MKFAVVNPDYKFGSEQYVSSSYKKIEEKDNPSNFGYGYYGKESDYQVGNKNYIYVDDKEDTVRYTLRIGNMSKKNFENLVIIDKLPDVGDTGVINLNKQRDSEFTVKISDNPNYEIYLLDNNQQVIESSKYVIEYTDEVEYTEDDWNGKENSKWYSEPKDTTKSFRIRFLEEFVVPSDYSVEFKFDGTIQDNAKPGKIAWNSFGYRYYVDGVQLSPEPPKVGVKIPYEPVLTKNVEDNLDGEFEFEIYEKGSGNEDKLVKTVKVRAGQTVKLELKKIVNGIESGYLEPGKDYIIKEATTKKFKEIHVEGVNGKAYAITEGGAFEFNYDKSVLAEVTFTNAQRAIGEVIINKYDAETNEPLSWAEFELRDEQGNTLNLEEAEDSYIYRKEESENTTTKVYTNEDGMLRITGLPYGDYVIYETNQPAGYIYGTENSYNFSINDETFEINANGEVIAKPVNINVYNEPTHIKIKKYFEEEIQKIKYSGNVSGALLQIWDKDKKEMYKEFTTDGIGVIDIDRLPKGEYVLVEEVAPNTFSKADDIYFEITNEGKLIINDNEIEDRTIEMKDDVVLGDIKINKKAEVLNNVGLFEIVEGFLQRVFSWITGTLKDVSFEIYASEDIYIQDMLVFEKDQLIDTITTDELGIATLSNIPVGQYYAVEIETGDNYELNKTPIELDLVYNGTDSHVVCEKTVENERKQATVNIHKTDSKNKEIPIENAVFGLYSITKQGIFKKDELVLVAITDEKGNATFGGSLPVGEYYIKEIKAPDGYYKSNEKIKFEFTETKEFNFEFVNEKKPEEKHNIETPSVSKLPYAGYTTPKVAISIILIIIIIANIILIVITKKRKGSN